MIDYVAILSRKYPGTFWSLNGDDYEGLDWQDDSEKPSQEELESYWEEVQATVRAELADAQRQQAYTAESDPIFFKWQRGEATEQDWLDAVESIRQRFPK